ncbi:hypothetical protein [Aquimarina longa]|uniref:hypothetical protein n=1 Tax=Aquimarina longa TaxID=1080221 RepID=UPI0007843536|nr:hypothetical protein [Aquimarina longa]
MKKIQIIALGFFFLGIFTSSLNAQDKGTSQISIGYGTATTNQLVSLLSDIIITAGTLGNATFDNNKSIGAINLNYKYAIIDKLMIGGSLVYEKIEDDALIQNKKIGERDNTFYTVGLEADYRYISKDVFQMYSGLGVAYTNSHQKFTSSSPTYKNDTYTINYFNYQLTAIGIRVGKSIAGFAELGFGYKGILNFGVSYQF